MKRCPHCGAQDNEDAIICKQCMRYFSAPASAPAVAAKTTQESKSSEDRGRREKKKGRTEAGSRTGERRRRSLFGALVRLALMGAVVLYMTQNWPDLAERIDGLLRPALDPDRAGVAEEPAATAEAAAPEPPVERAPAAPPPPAPERAAEPAPVDASPAPVEPRAVAPAARTAAKTPAKIPPKAPARPEPEAAPVRADPPAPPPRAPEAPARAESAAARPPAQADPVRVGGNIKAPRKIRDAAPQYPPAARAARVQGIVIIEATIDTDGKVAQARVLRSVPMLDEPAVDAVRQWEYEPTVLNGVKVPVIMTVTVRFTLQ